LFPLTNALDIRFPRANPDVCAGASVGPEGCCGRCYGKKSINIGNKNGMFVGITHLTLWKDKIRQMDKVEMKAERRNGQRGDKEDSNKSTQKA
jgi:hypothetical protein